MTEPESPLGPGWLLADGSTFALEDEAPSWSSTFPVSVLTVALASSSASTFSLPVLDELSAEPRGAGRTSLMLMDAAERKSAGLPVIVVAATEHEIGIMRKYPDAYNLTRDDFTTLGSIVRRPERLRGHFRSSVFVDHYVWEVGTPEALAELRSDLGMMPLS